MSLNKYDSIRIEIQQLERSVTSSLLRSCVCRMYNQVARLLVCLRPGASQDALGDVSSANRFATLRQDRQVGKVVLWMWRRAFSCTAIVSLKGSGGFELLLSTSDLCIEANSAQFRSTPTATLSLV